MSDLGQKMKMVDPVRPPSEPLSAEDLIGQATRAESVENALELLHLAAALVSEEMSALSAWIDGLAGYVLYRSGSLDQSRSRFEASEARWAAVPVHDSPKRRAATYCNYASLLCDLGAYRAARSRMEAALDIERNIFGPSDPEYARTLANFARLLRATGEAEEACRYARRAVEILESSETPRDRLDALYARNILGMALMESGFWSDALTLFKALLILAEQAEAPDIYFSVLNNVGWSLYGIGDYGECAAWEEKALDIVRERPGGAARMAEATLLTNLAAVRHKLEDFDEACRIYEKASAVLKHVLDGGKSPQMASICCNWGASFYRLGRFAEARAQYDQALALRLEIDGETHRTTADVRFHLAELTFAEGAIEDSLEQAIAILALSGLHSSPDGVWRVFNLISRALDAKDRNRLAILFGKEAVEILETMRLGVVALGQRAEEQFSLSRATGYRGLADQLVTNTRLAEAEYVLERLRAAEQNDLLGRDSGLTRAGRPGFSRQEEEWRRRYSAALARIAGLRTQLNEFLETGGDPEDVAAARRGIAAATAELADAVTALVRDQPSDLFPPVANTVQAISDRPGIALQPREIFLHFFPADSHFWVLRRDGQGNAVKKRIEADEATISSLILDFRYALSSPSTPLDAVKAASERLYDLLLRPILEDELPSGARLLLWLDGALRFMPPAALFDGTRYLVEKFPIILYSPFANPTASRRGLNRCGVGGFAVGREVEGFATLPFAVKEIETVIGDPPGNGLFGGERFLDDRFTPENLKRAAGEFGSVLIATHFVLRPADLARSGLLMGTGDVMPVRDIAELDFAGLSLMTISGCDTGTAGLDGDAVMLQSFADRLVLRGVGSVLAALWRVADAGSARLVIDFYANLASGGATDFAAALARAQMTMARGAPAAVSFGNNTMRGIGGYIDEADNDLTAIDFRHPYYWAAFVLLGEAGAAQ